MNYRLMHKNVPVLEFLLDEATGAIVSIGEVCQKEHIPVGISYKKEKTDRTALNNWWQRRAIPASRQGIRDALQEMNVYMTQNLLDKCLRLF